MIEHRTVVIRSWSDHWALQFVRKTVTSPIYDRFLSPATDGYWKHALFVVRIVQSASQFEKMLKHSM